MKHIIQKCLHWITSDIKQTIAEVKYAFRRRSQRVLLAVQMAARVVILVEFVIMSICLDYSWFGEIVVIWYFILLVTDSKHLLRWFVLYGPFLFFHIQEMFSIII